METRNGESWSQWTTEVRRGVLQLLVLSILNRYPSHGFEIVKKIRRSSDGLIDLPGGTIYPLLNRLEKKGLLRVVTWEYDRRKRKTYALTEEGKGVLAESLDYWQKLVILVDIFTKGARIK